MQKSTIRITVLVENTVYKPRLLAEHGLAFWIEYGGTNLLFDTGQSAAVVHNSECLGIDLARADAMVLSHGHYDHTGGLTAVDKLCPNAPLYLCPPAVEIKYSTTRGHIHEVGMSPEARELIRRKDGIGQVAWVKKPAEIVPGLWCTGPIPRRHPVESLCGVFVRDPQGIEEDIIPDDQALVLETDAGPLVVLGCGHSGVMNTLSYIQSLRGEPVIRGLFGGLHLSGGDPARLTTTIDFLSQCHLACAGPAHCSGSAAMEQLRALTADGFHRLSSGSTVEITGARPHLSM